MMLPRLLVSFVTLTLMVACPQSSPEEEKNGTPWQPSKNSTTTGMPDNDGNSTVENAANSDTSENAGTNDSNSDPRPGACDPGTHPLDESAPCNPARPGDCPGDGFCTFAIVEGPPPTLACLPRDQEGSGESGDPCTRILECREGLTCANMEAEPDPRESVCLVFCELETNEGCDDGEFCTTFERMPPTDGIGVCIPSCDPYDPESCPQGQTCAIDYNYPDTTCAANFRCVTSSSDGGAGDSCGPGDAVAGCSRGLSCYEVTSGQYECVQPCESDDDCSAACGDPTGPWQLRYCE